MCVCKVREGPDRLWFVGKLCSLGSRRSRRRSLCRTINRLGYVPWFKHFFIIKFVNKFQYIIENTSSNCTDNLAVIEAANALNVIIEKKRAIIMIKAEMVFLGCTKVPCEVKIPEIHNKSSEIDRSSFS